jgi:hypothetical protein
MYIEMYTTWKILLLGNPRESRFQSSALKVKTHGNCNKITAFLYYPSVQSPNGMVDLMLSNEIIQRVIINKIKPYCQSMEEPIIHSYYVKIPKET